MQVRIEHSFLCSDVRFWALQFDAVWVHRMLVEGLGYGGCVVQAAVETPEGLRRELEMVPKLHVPDVVGKALGRSLIIRETGRFVRATNTWHWQQKLSVLADKITISGTIRTEPEGESRCRRFSEVTFEARMFGVGGLIEKAAESNIRRGFDESAAWTTRWLTENPTP